MVNVETSKSYYKVFDSVDKDPIAYNKCQMSEQSPAEYPMIDESMFCEASVADTQLYALPLQTLPCQKRS